ncbi:hypothetical protein ACVOMV_10930 [Mesorhizobium atlanticum]
MKTLDREGPKGRNVHEHHDQKNCSALDRRGGRHGALRLDFHLAGEGA